MKPVWLDLPESAQPFTRVILRLQIEASLGI